MTDRKYRVKMDGPGYTKNNIKHGVNPNNLIKIRPIQTHSSSFDKISVGIMNTQSIRNKTDLVKETISDYNTDICIYYENMVETCGWFFQSWCYPGWLGFPWDCQGDGRVDGGTGIICRQQFKPVKVELIIPHCNSFEHSVYNLCTFNNDLSVVAVYRPPNLTSFNDFITDFSDLLSAIITSPKKF